MQFVWSVLWGTLITACGLYAFNVMIPYMKVRIIDDTDISESSNNQKVRSKTREILVIAFCGIFATICGYYASMNALGMISMAKLLLAMAILCIAAITDLEMMLIPNKCSLALIVGRIILVAIEYIVVPETSFIRLGNSCISLILTFICLFVMNRLTKGGLGMGDVKLLTSVGFLCGIQASFVTLMFSFLFCIPVCLYLIVVKKEQMSMTLPLGPFILVGFGTAIILALL